MQFRHAASFISSHVKKVFSVLFLSSGYFIVDIPEIM